MTEQKITATRTIDAPADVIFKVLSNPERHAQLDGSGLVQSDEKSDRITEVGQTFTMNMEWEKMGGGYKTENHVVGFDENKLLAWKTTYDWSDVTDKEVPKKVGFPAIPQEDLESSLENLASAVSQT